ncbi:hypothetical protein [Buttiauxella ferragutiae]|uniref:hypothetical protein n=1 Tax=Buttiauxella ferragutiae TaxID=82989 RepID=UPI001F536FE5|nr:hypothetical protein [Buttiauxella ferragutiae]UNK61061.1 hypothetical protein MNO13_22445 [Buttiauxella ferragutiae]
MPKNDLDHILTTCVGMGVQLLRQYLNDFINTFFLNDGGMFDPKQLATQLGLAQQAIPHYENEI